MTKDWREVVKFSGCVYVTFPACARWRADHNHRKRKLAAGSAAGPASMNPLPAIRKNILA
jgi:hypothetical protein